MSDKLPFHQLDNKPFDEASGEIKPLIEENIRLNKLAAKLDSRVVSLREENDRNQVLIKTVFDLKQQIASLVKEHETTVQSYEKRIDELRSEIESVEKKKSREGKRSRQTDVKREKLFQAWGQRLEKHSAKDKIVNGKGEDSYHIVLKEDSFFWTAEDFESVFGGYGNIIHHESNKKRKINSMTMRFHKSQLEKLFGGTISLSGYKIQAWRKKGNFKVSQKEGTWDGCLNSLDVHFDPEGFLNLRFGMITGDCVTTRPR